MEIKIRNLDETTVRALDDLARAQKKSRNAYLAEQLRLLAVYPKLRQQEEKYAKLVELLCQIIQENTEVLQHLEKEER